MVLLVDKVGLGGVMCTLGSTFCCLCVVPTCASSQMSAGALLLRVTSLSAKNAALSYMCLDMQSLTRSRRRVMERCGGACVIWGDDGRAVLMITPDVKMASFADGDGDCCNRAAAYVLAAIVWTVHTHGVSAVVHTLHFLECQNLHKIAAQLTTLHICRQTP